MAPWKKHIPQKTLCGRWDIPWMTRDIKRDTRDIRHTSMDTWINTTSCPITNTGLGLSTLVRPNSSVVTTVDDLAKSLDHGRQVDMLILDFSKAFDMVAHQRLINKLDNYGITNNGKIWITTWLTSRTQRVVVDGEQSSDARVHSGVPQGTVLAPLMFLLYINDIGDKISNNTKIILFTDDSLLYRETGNNLDTNILQHDLDTLV